MTFDPFGDFEQAGYLRNFAKTKDEKKIKELEHQFFLAHLPTTLDWLATQPLTYDTLLEIHKRIFAGLYPWAGCDRLELTPTRTVTKGSTCFAVPQDIQFIFLKALDQPTPERVLAGLALAHPFLDGNGRAIFLFFGEHLRRQGYLVRFDQIPKVEFLNALSQGIDGDVRALRDILQENTVKFAFVKPKIERLSRVLSGVNWGREGLDGAYQENPTFLQKVMSKLKT